MIEAETPVNYDALDALKSVLGVGFADLVHDFRTQMADGMVRLELALAGPDRNKVKVKAIAHTLKGSALSLHCKPLADCCGRLERGAERDANEALDVLLEELRDTVRDTLAAIEVWAA